MRISMLLILAGATLAGCAVVPVGGPPGVYLGVQAPAVVVRPSITMGYVPNGYYYSDRHYVGARYRHWH
jgi:hypothetical protein